MKKITITDDSPLKATLPSNGEDIVLVRDGHAVALITPFDDDDLDWYEQEHDPAFIESIRRGRDDAAAGRAISHEELKRELGIGSTEELLNQLVDERGAVPVAAAEANLPDEPGFCAVFVDADESLPDFIREHLRARRTKLIYLGTASQSLRTRLLDQNLRHKKASTFFRTLGAVLGYKPPAGSLQHAGNRQNYSFSDRDTAAIVNWIDAHLRLKWLVAHRGRQELSATIEPMIRRLCPAFNLEHNPQKIGRIEQLRDECRRIAAGASDAA